MATHTPLKPVAQGKPMSRVDGLLKVTGAATYPAEFAKPDYARVFLVMSEISNGTIMGIDTAAAEKAPGVLVVITHLNALKLSEPKNDKNDGGIRLEERIPFSDVKIGYGGQYVAAVVAKTLEQARHAGDLVKVTYDRQVPVLQKADVPDQGQQPKKTDNGKQQIKKGDPDKVFAKAEFVQIHQTYKTPTETHNPMETSATVAVWEGAEKLTVYDATQYVKGTQATLAEAFGLKRENVRVFCPFVGGAFGSKGPIWPHTFVAVMAAKMAGVPVKLELTRQQMFSGTGHRTPTTQTITLAASGEGKLQAMRHETDNLTSVTGAWIESCGPGSTGVLYDAPAIEITSTMYPVNIAQPSFMRAPGECPGTYALESAMDELAVALKLDPLALRMVNLSANHPIKEKPFSAKFLREAYELGAEKFGWNQRTAEPRSMREGRDLIGYGMATATYPANQWEATAKAVLKADGTGYVSCATHDLGTGAYTAFTQISADALGLPVEKVKFDLGSSDFTFGPVAGGSNSTATVGSAITLAGEKMRQKLAVLASKEAESPLHGMKADDLELADGRLVAKGDASKGESYSVILQRAALPELETMGELKAHESSDFIFNSFGAHFCEVRIDAELPLVRVTRVVSVMNGGRVINPKLAASQIIGGVVMGIGMALEEETLYDPATGLPVTRDLANYHVPVQADVPQIEAHFVGEPDFQFNPMGARGLGEIGITGIAAAIANAVYHATGRRVRELPITLDKLI